MADLHTLPGVAPSATPSAKWDLDSRVGATLHEIAMMALSAANMLDEHDPDHTVAAHHLCRQIAAIADITRAMCEGRAAGRLGGDMVDWIAPWLK